MVTSMVNTEAPATLQHNKLAPHHATKDQAVGAFAHTAVDAELVQSSNSRLRGVASYCPIQRFGFIRCEGLHVYVTQAEAEKCKLTAGAHVTFSLRAGQDGKLEAHEINVLIQGAPRGLGRMQEFAQKLGGAEINWNNSYEGKIVRLFKDTGPLPASMRKKDPGWCFIACPETHKIFGYDIWAYPAQVAGYKIRDNVIFRIRFDRFWNYPVAQDIRPGPPRVKVGAANLGLLEKAETIASITSGLQAAEQLVDPQELRPGAAVRLVGLKAAADLNGAIGKCVQKQDGDGRWLVELTTGVSKWVKPENLELDMEGSAPAISASAPVDPDLHGACPFSGDPSIMVAARTEDSTVHASESTMHANRLGDSGDEAHLMPTTSYPKGEAFNGAEAANVEPYTGEDAAAQLSGRFSKSKWEKYQTDDGRTWWHRESDGDWFMEDDPGPWTKYIDANSGKHYWWKSNDHFFWIE